MVKTIEPYDIRPNQNFRISQIASNVTRKNMEAASLKYYVMEKILLEGSHIL